MTWHRLPRGHGASSPSALTLAAVALLAGLNACGEEGPAGPEEQPYDQAPPGLSVSDPIATDQVLAYVSASPGTFPGGESVTVTNLANGASVGASMLEGGFDPIAIAAEPDNELETVVRFADGSSATFLIRLPMHRPPRVVRTRPPKGETDVVLNATATVVFSEPVDDGTVTDETVQLRLDGEPVEGVVTLAEDGLRAEFVPVEPLQPGGQYTLVITRGVLDLSGDPLEEEVQASFTTEGNPIPSVTLLSPEHAIIGEGEFTLTVDGADFVASSVVRWNGSDRSTTRADGGTLLATIPASDVATVGAVSITVFNPPPGGGVSEPITFPVLPAVSGQIAYHSWRDGDAEIYLMNADGTDQVNLTNSPGNDQFPQWSPDGSKLAFRSNRDGNYDIYVMNADGTGQVNLTNSPGDDCFADADRWTESLGANCPAWSPDGSRMAFVSSEEGLADIYLMNADGTGVVKLTQAGKSSNCLRGALGRCSASGPTWSPDGSRIAFMWERDENYEIYVMNADGGGQDNLTNSLGDEGAPVWSPDGSKILFGYWENGGWPHLYVMNADGTGRVNVSKPWFTDFLPAWSPDGAKIAFYHEPDWQEPGDIYVVNPDGTGLRNLTNSPEKERSSDWSPDGSWIVFEAQDYSLLHGWFDTCVYVMSAYGTGRVRLANAPCGDEAPQWRPRR